MNETAPSRMFESAEDVALPWDFYLEIFSRRMSQTLRPGASIPDSLQSAPATKAVQSRRTNPGGVK